MESILKDMRLKDFNAAVKDQLNLNVRESQVEELPETNEELELHMQLSYKQSAEIAEEEAINMLLDGNKYELIEVTIPLPSTRLVDNRWTESDERVCVYLKMINPSTGDYHLEGVPREIDSQADFINEDTVKAALAWRDGEIPQRGFHGKDAEWKEKLSNYSYIEPTTLT